MSEIFGIEFDKHIYKSLFDDIEFRDLKALLASKSTSNKLQYFVQEFPALLERPDFINIFSHVLYTSSNQASAGEIFEGLNKLMRLSHESQFKILIAFFYSLKDKFKEEVINIFTTKCQEFHKEAKSDQLTSGTLQTLLLIINSSNVFKTEFFSGTFVNFLISTQGHHSEEAKGITDIENLLETTSTADDSIEFEKVLHDLGPLIINNNININRPELIDTKLDERRLAQFIIFLCKHQSWVEDKENRYLNKVFLKTLNNDLSMTIDETTEKKINVSWNVDSFYKMFKNQFENFEVSINLYLV